MTKDFINKNNTKHNMLTEGNIINGGYGGNTFLNDRHSFKHPSLDEIMDFVSSTEKEILNDPDKILKMLVHFCKCDECANIRNEMIAINEEIDLALTIVTKG